MPIKDTILAAKDSALEALEIQEWDCTIHLRQWTGEERNKVIACKDDLKKLSELVLMLTICEESGERCFDDKTVKQLMGKSHIVLDRITQAALKHNGLYAEASEDAKKN